MIIDIENLKIIGQGNTAEIYELCDNELREVSEEAISFSQSMTDCLINTDL